MEKRKQRVFKQLEDRERALPRLLPRLLPPPTQEEKIAIQAKQVVEALLAMRGTKARVIPDSLGAMARSMERSPEVLIEQFERAGIQGLTPDFVVSKEQRAALVRFLRDPGKYKVGAVYSDSNLGERAVTRYPELIVVHDINLELLSRLRQKPDLIYSLDSRKFEELVARLFEDQGCEVALTKRTRDGGYDIFGRIQSQPASIVFLAECKRYSRAQRVGVGAVRSLYGVVEAQRANIGLIVTTSSFTKDAREEKIRIGPRIELREFDDLCKWLSPY